MSDYQGNIIIKNPATPTGPATTGRAPGMWKLSEVAYWIKQGVWPDPAIVPDQYFPYVSLLLSTTSLGNANNNLFVDSSGAFNPMSRNGNTTQGSFTPYSTNWSNYFDASGDYERISSSQTALQFGTGDFTVEGWVYSTGATGTFQQILTGGTSWTSGSGGVYWYYNGGSPYIGAAWNQIATNPAVNSGTLAINTWHHFAVVRSGNTLILYVNGTSVDTLDVTGVSIAVNNQSQTNIGGGGWDQDFGGYLSNLRVVKGTAVYTANFTVPTSPLTAISGTSLLTCQSNRFRDASTNNFTITVAGNTSVTDFGPFSPSTYAPIAYNQSDITNWSGYFDGSGDYLSVPASSSLTLGTGDFTIEMWLYSGANSTSTRLAGNGAGAGWGANKWVMGTGYAGSANKFFMSVNNGGTLLTSTTTFNDSAWHHAAVTRSGNTWRLFVDGVQEATLTSSVSVDGGVAANISIGSGQISGDADWAGFISNFRIVKGAAVYTSNFTPSTTNLTAISGTSLLTLQNAAFTDSSTNNFVITPFGNTTVTGNSPFNTVGYWSNYFDGSSYLAAANNAAIQLGTGAFTVEGWFNIPSYAANQPLFDQRASGPSSNAFVIYVKTTGTLAFYSYSPGIDVTFNTVISTNAWNHFAFVRSGNTGTMYVNGVAQSTTIDLSAYNNTSSANRIMQSFDPSYATGYLSNFRIVKGTAVYTANFTPPTAPLTAISGTGLLTCQSSRFIDSSSNALTITVNGSPSVQSFDPFYTATVASNGGSLYLDGSGDYLTSPTSPAYDFRSSNFTIEGWFYFTNSTANALQTLYTNYTSFSSAGSIFFGKHTNNSGYVTVWFSSYSTGGPLLAETTYPPNNAWTHYAVVRNGNTFTLYRNGVATATASWSGAATSGSNAIWVGAAGDAVTAYNFPGYMSDFRITKSAVYTAAFTPPTAPVTPTAATTLLLNGMNAGIYDATTINDMETVGNAQVSTVQSKFGGSSVYFGGLNNWLDFPANPTADFGTGDITIECWLYVTSTATSYQSICQFGNAAVTSGFHILTNNNTICLRTNNSQPLTTSGTITANTWNHIALTRASGTTRIFINGTTSGGTYNWTASLSSGSTRRIGGDIYSNALTGYIDDFRVTNGVARYTANFTPPTQAFPVY